jgi:hypothetical protein
VSASCILCRGPLFKDRAVVCSECLPGAALHSWRRWEWNVAGPDNTPKHPYGGPVSVRHLVQANGRLGPDPKYGREKRDRAGSRPVSDAEIALHHSLGEDLRPALARWYASLGLSAAEIADRFRVESLSPGPRKERRATVSHLRCFFEFAGQCRGKIAPSAAQNPTHGYCEKHFQDGLARAYWKRRAPTGAAVTAATVRRWADYELRQYQAQRRLVLESHPLVRDARRLRVEDPWTVLVQVADLIIECHQTRAQWPRIVLEEVERQIRPLHLRRCEHCRELFLANRKGANLCSARCRKAASRANVTVNRPVSDTLTISEEGILMPTAQVLPKAEVISQVIGRLDAQDRLLHRIERTLADISWGVFKMTGDSTLAGRVVDALIESAWAEEAA